MSDEQFLWRPQDAEGAAEEDAAFLNYLRADQIALSKRANCKVGCDVDLLVSIISEKPRPFGQDVGVVRCRGQAYLFELIRTELTWTECPFSPYDRFNFKREVSVCTLDEAMAPVRKVLKMGQTQ